MARGAAAPDTAARAIRSLRRGIGAAVALGGALLLAGQVAEAARLALAASETLRLGVLFSLLAGLATGVGALPLLFVHDLAARTRGLLFAAAGGLMLGAAVFGLLMPAFGTTGASGGAGVATVIVAALAGALVIAGFDRLLPHLHALPEGTASKDAVRSGWLMVVAIGLHNVPEGLAVGASFQASDALGAGQAALGMVTALGIGIQNLPEGLIVALAMRSMGASRTAAIAVATLTSLFEPVGAVIGGAAAGASAAMLPAAMAFAAGAMLFVVAHDVVPNAARALRAGPLGAGLCAGVAAMAMLAG